MVYDLSLVAPDRRDEVLRRITIIDSFLKGRGRKAAEAHARELGLGVAQFYNLVRSWEASRRPERLVGAGDRRERALGVTSEQSAHMDAVIAEDPRAAPADLVAAIERTAAAKGLAMPRREIVARYVARARPPLLPAHCRDSQIMLDQVVIDIPVRSDSEVIRPMATFTIDTATEAAVGMSLSLGHPSPGAAAASLLDALRHGQRHATAATAPRLRLPRPQDGIEAWAALDDVLDEAGMEVDAAIAAPRSYGAIVEALLGRRHGRIEMRPRLVSAPLKDRLMRGYSALAPMTLEVATEYARSRLVGLRTSAAFAFLDDLSRDRLDNQLLQLSRG
ncbi:hypothetical protein [uncultured Sphingomonas sp.]|uniref:hypothetical protein n=1 Tax=uncultured Sphingomonas sp. TaxID=158754 RepID=UPI0026094103|nr:hypothetical protein [uncultured Sphingomonas sp.]